MRSSTDCSGALHSFTHLIALSHLTQLACCCTVPHAIQYAIPKNEKGIIKADLLPNYSKCILILYFRRKAEETEKKYNSAPSEKMTKMNASFKLNVPDVVSSLMHAEDVMKVEAVYVRSLYFHSYCSAQFCLFSAVSITSTYQAYYCTIHVISVHA